MSENTEVGVGRRMLLGVVALVGTGVLFVVGMDVIVNRLAPTVASPFPVYTAGFLFGTWSILTMTFVSNYIGKKLYGVPCVTYKFPKE